MFGEELHAVPFQSRDRILLSRVQSRHHRLGTNVDLVRIEEPVERKQAPEQREQLHFHSYST